LELRIISAERAFECLVELKRADVEEFWALALGPSKSLISKKMLFRGTVDACLAHPRDVFRFACQVNASSIIVAHNHPSEDLRPSQEDIALTQRLIQAGEILEIPIIDHLIVTHRYFLSTAKQDWWIETHSS
jgi:DNA repair protein RadC